MGRVSEERLAALGSAGPLTPWVDRLANEDGFGEAVQTGSKTRHSLSRRQGPLCWCGNMGMQYF